jgi:hypothetical protein
LTTEEVFLSSSSSEAKEPSLPEEQPQKKIKTLETTLLFIKEYCVSFIEFIRHSEDHKVTFIENIYTPIVYNNFEYLKAYRTTMAHENDPFYNSHEK